MKLGGAELLVIVLVMVFVLGPERTVLYARKAGKWLRVLKVYLSSMTEDLRETVIEPLQEIQEPLKAMAKPIDELTEAVAASAEGISDSLEKASQDIGRSIPAAGRNARDPGAVPETETAGTGCADTLEMAEFMDDAS